jgi:predicted nuclease of predicted toxin-antitoxin system
MPSPKLYLNVHLSPRLAQQLRQLGFDVISTLEAGMLEADDDEQLSFAVLEQKAIVTFNHKHFSILLFPPSRCLVYRAS